MSRSPSPEPPFISAPSDEGERETEPYFSPTPIPQHVSSSSMHKMREEIKPVMLEDGSPYPIVFLLILRNCQPVIPTIAGHNVPIVPSTILREGPNQEEVGRLRLTRLVPTHRMHVR